MNLTQTTDKKSRALVGLACLAVGTAVNCGTETGTVSYAYEDPYLYTAYYPADVAYSSYYWTDDWAYNDLYFQTIGTPAVTGGPTTTIGQDAGTTATDAGTTATDAGSNSALTVRGAVGAAIRALARGESVCPGQVTVTPKTATPACLNGTSTTARAGVTIVFNACVLPDGGTVSGTVDVTSNQAAGVQTCDPSTIVTLGHTTTLTNLSYVGVSGAKIVIPNQTDTSSTMFNFGSTPAQVTISSMGQVQTFGPNGVMVSDQSFTSNRTYKFAGSTASYTIDGTVMITDNRVAGSTATLTLTGITRTQGCCRPTGGTLVINRTGGQFPGQHTWVFTSTCGTVTRDGVSAVLPACI